MSPPYPLVIFDFDGTLADSYPWFVSVLNGVADRYRFRRVASHEVESLRRMSAAEIMRHLGVAWWKLPLIARHMRALAAAEIERIPLFAGTEAMLTRLSSAGVTLAVVSSNSQANVRRVLGPAAALIGHYGCGTALFGKRRKFREALRRTGFRPEQAICIGDEIRDHEAATAEGIAFGAVTWGYTDGKALRVRQPAAVFERVEELAERLG